MVACVLAGPAALGSDDRGGDVADVLRIGVPVSADLTNANIEAGEPATSSTSPIGCVTGTTSTARTMTNTGWYRVVGTGMPVTLSTAGSSYDTVMAVYPVGSSQPLTCVDDPPSGGLQAVVTDLPTTQGSTYEVQVGLASGACPCRLDLVATGAWPRLGSKTSMSAELRGTHTYVSKLTVKHVPVGSTVRLTCAPKGKGCGTLKTKTLTVASSPVQLGHFLKKRRLEGGVRITVVVTKPGYIGDYTRFTVRRHKLPRKEVFCVEPGGTAPQTTCS